MFDLVPNPEVVDREGPGVMSVHRNNQRGSRRTKRCETAGDDEVRSLEHHHAAAAGPGSHEWTLTSD
jgi:hypothetical protein